MGLFDRLKKQKNTNSSNLEALLIRAAKEPAYRSEFYKQLILTKLVVITNDNSLPQGQFHAKEDTKIDILSLEDGRVPVFTSTERIFDKGVIKKQVNFLELQAVDLFKMLSGKTLLLNPYSDYGKVLLPNELERLFDGTFFTENIKPIQIKKHDAFAIGQPAEYPDKVVKSLIELFSNRPNVYAAYLGWIQNSATDEPPHYIFAIDGTGDLDNLFQEAGFTAKEVMEEDKFIDFIKIDNKDGISDYFTKSTIPFYKK